MAGPDSSQRLMAKFQEYDGHFQGALTKDQLMSVLKKIDASGYWNASLLDQVLKGTPDILVGDKVDICAFIKSLFEDDVSAGTTESQNNTFDGMWWGAFGACFFAIHGKTLFGDGKSYGSIVSQISEDKVSMQWGGETLMGEMSADGTIRWDNGDTFRRMLDFSSVLESLQSREDWALVKLDNVEISFPSRTGTKPLLSCKSNQISALLELSTQAEEARSKAVQTMLAQNGLAAEIFGSGRLLDGVGSWQVGTYAACGDMRQDANSEVLLGTTLARLHKCDNSWFEGPLRNRAYRDLPLLFEESAGSALWPLVCHEFGQGAGTRVPLEGLRSLMAAVPRPVGEHAAKVVSVHGDLWPGNVVKAAVNSPTLVTGFKHMSVSSAAQDLIHMPSSSMIRAYLQTMLDREPTSDEVEELKFEARIAEHLHFCIFRLLIWGSRDMKPDQLSQVCDECIDHVRTLAEIVAQARTDPSLRRAVLMLSDPDPLTQVRTADPRTPEYLQKVELLVSQWR
eukprot:TRINITY_DN39460_c0_g1_i1.p1 TRINITY_DN39460_c0_g1~~TRINITY_DN39460_c0_g1_i1.p1  ORF type:complete len:510 (-),score=62.80 TRINITY_DN39460_c0_g1_i1:109-1638(-)